MSFPQINVVWAGAGAGGSPGNNAAAVRAGALELRRRRPDAPRHLPRPPARLHELLPGTLRLLGASITRLHQLTARIA